MNWTALHTTCMAYLCMWMCIVKVKYIFTGSQTIFKNSYWKSLFTGRESKLLVWGS